MLDQDADSVALGVEVGEGLDVDACSQAPSNNIRVAGSKTNSCINFRSITFLLMLYRFVNTIIKVTGGSQASPWLKGLKEPIPVLGRNIVSATHLASGISTLRIMPKPSAPSPHRFIQ